MRRKFDLVLSAAFATALLTSCGGGGGTPSPTPSPSSSGTPTPTATPTPVVFDFAQTTEAQSGLIYITANFTPTGGTAVFSDASRIVGTGGFRFVLTPESVDFGFPDLATAATFLGSERTATSATARTYTRTTTSLLAERPFTHALRASYSRSDPFTSGTTAGSLQSTRVGLFVVPQATTTPALASTITFTGTPRVTGGTRGTTTPGTVSAAVATITITPPVAPATTPTVTGTIRISETVAGLTTERAVLAVSGTLTSTTGTLVSGTANDTANAFAGTFVGSLAGPAREELALVFAATHTDGRKYVGDLIAD